MQPKTIAILGGTGELGTGLARRWCEAGHRILIGSRSVDKAEAAAAALRAIMHERGVAAPAVHSAVNAEAAASADLAVLTVPFEHQTDTLQALREQLQGKILVDVTVPLMPPRVGTVQLPAEGSAALAAKKVLGDGVRLVSAFQNVAAHHLQEGGGIDCDVLVSADDREAADEVIELVRLAGMRGFYAGPLANAVVAEALTSVLIRLNRQYKCRSGLRITGTDE